VTFSVVLGAGRARALYGTAVIDDCGTPARTGRAIGAAVISGNSVLQRALGASESD
jgi:hypothetical protein